MVTSHEFARQLLAGPDLPIVTPFVECYDDAAENMADPAFTKDTLETSEGVETDVLVISYR